MKLPDWRSFRLSGLIQLDERLATSLFRGVLSKERSCLHTVLDVQLVEDIA